MMVVRGVGVVALMLAAGEPVPAAWWSAPGSAQDAGVKAETGSALLDRAGAEIDGLAKEVLDLTVFFGMPTGAQRARVRQAAERALEFTTRAEERLSAEVREVQARSLALTSPTAEARAEAAKIEERLSVLIDQEQSVRMPLLRGRAAALIAAASEDREARGRMARGAVEVLGGMTLAEPAERMRRALLASAVWAGSEGEAGREADRAAAREGFLSAVGAPGSAGMMGILGSVVSAPDAEAVKVAIAQLGAASASAPWIVTEGPHAGKREAGLALLAAQAAARGMMRTAGTVEAGARQEWYAEACRVVSDVTAREDVAPLGEGVMRRAVLATLGELTDLGGKEIRLSELEAQVSFARGVMLARRGGEAARKEAAMLLAGVAERDDRGDLGAESLWELGVMLSASGDVADEAGACEALCRLAAEYPQDRRAGEAARGAIEFARHGLVESAKKSENAALATRFAAAYRRALGLAYRLLPEDPESPLWRLESARIAIDGESLTCEELDGVLSALEGVRDPRRAEADGLARRAIEKTMTGAEAARRADCARRAIAWAQTRQPAMADLYRVELGEALLELKDARAMAVYTQLAQSPLASRAGDAARIALGVGRAQRLDGRPAEGFATLRGLVEGIDTAGGQRSTPEYWRAWAEMLEILAERPVTDRKNTDVLAQIRRLELIDGNFGDAESKRRIVKVKGSVGGK